MTATGGRVHLAGSAGRCAAIAAREAEIPWEAGAYTGVDQVGRETETTPLDVPLHPGAARWYREQGFIV